MKHERERIDIDHMCMQKESLIRRRILSSAVQIHFLLFNMNE